MIGLFLNPGFLLIAAALVSVPIIIHLINRMRFKRIRWAAMEFLLKAQKRTRRRLIIEQLLLLALRCMLIGLVGLLVSRFIGCGDSNTPGKPNLHIALLDDTPSMQDQWTVDGGKQSCFDVAKNDILIKKITKGLSQSKSNDRLIVIPLSQVIESDFKPEVFEKLNTPEKLKEADSYITELKPSMVHVGMLEAVKRAQKEMEQYPESQITLHILSDFRHNDWSSSKADALIKEVNGMVHAQKGIKIRLIDTVHPSRSAAQSFPDSRDNVGILDIQPSTRIIGTNMPVQFTVTLKNFSGKQAEFHVEARDESTGKDMLEVNQSLSPQNPIKLLPNAVGTATFEKRFIPEKANEPYFAHVSVRLVNALKQPLDNDGLLADNIRYAVVEVRDKVPILVVDGNGPKGREENKDSFFIHCALVSVPGSSYQLVYGDELAPGNATNPTRALERPDLNKFPTIFLLNVRDLTPKQTANLENYVKEGGGVAFFMGNLVNSEWYNSKLYKNGKGLFPAPIQREYYPDHNSKELEPKGSDTYQIIVREDKFVEPSKTPIFGKMFLDPSHKKPLRDLPIRRYFKVAEGQWKPDPGRVMELATLPNDASADRFNAEVAAITQTPAVHVKAIKQNEELAKYRASLQKHLAEIDKCVQVGSESKAYHLAAKIDELFNDKGSGKDAVNMTEFWANSDADVQTLRRDLASLRDRVNYGDPFVIAQKFGKGKVVAIMSTAGKDWNDWGGGSMAQVLYQPFIWEMQNFLSDQGSEANLFVGRDLDLVLDAEQFRGARLKLVRTYKKPKDGAPAEDVKIGEPEGQLHDGQLHFKMTKNTQPGVYISKLVDDNTPDKTLALFAHAFNVDTDLEGDLQRVSSDDLDKDYVAPNEGAVKPAAVGTQDDVLISRVNDFSESPWLFLIFLFVLVAEQALAVHLSFHMKGDDTGLAPAGTGGKATTV